MHSLSERSGINFGQHLLVAGAAEVVGGPGEVLVLNEPPQPRVGGSGVGGDRVPLQGLGLAQGPSQGAGRGCQAQQQDAQCRNEQVDSGVPGFAPRSTLRIVTQLGGGGNWWSAP